MHYRNRYGSLGGSVSLRKDCPGSAMHFSGRFCYNPFIGYVIEHVHVTRSEETCWRCEGVHVTGF